MADEFQSSICTNNNWWNMVRTAPPPPPSSMSCSAALNDSGVGGGGVFNWLTEQPIKGRSSSCDETAVSVSCAPSNSMDLIAPVAMMDWNQALLRNSESNQTTKDWGLRIFEDASEEAFKEMNQSFLIDQTHFSSSTAADDPPVTCQGLPINRFSMGSSVSYGFPSNHLVQGMFEPESNARSPYCANPSEFLPQSWPKLHLKQQPQQQNQLQFSNNTPYWNASSVAMNEFRPSTPKFLGQVFEEKPNCSNNSASKSDSSSSSKKSSCEPAMKKPRIETPSSLPTFKVRRIYNKALDQGDMDGRFF
ncbi:Transcription factor [Acorus gramineus]|uniref:Transcription factor n=1 Tax=Acorus gramineus TaxID=55184 RepID=A0AAV9A8V8_ACOGR|nr:Transcription factor [Acorus gramineus]